MIPYHLTNLALPTHTSSHICKLSCTQASPSPHAGTRLRFYRNRTHDISHPLIPRCWLIHDVRGAHMQAPFLNHIPSSTTTPPSLAPCIPSTVAMNNLNPPQGYKGFFKVSSFKISKRPQYLQNFQKPFRVKGLQGLIL